MMATLITALTGLITAVAMLLAGIFLLRMVKPLSVAVLLFAERKSEASLPAAFLQQLRDHVSTAQGSNDTER